MDIRLLLLRLTLGLTLTAHGTQKLFGWFGGPGLRGTGRFFIVLGFPPGRRHVLVAMLGETISDVILAAGFVTRLAVVLRVMLVATVTTVHLGKGFFVQNGGYGYAFVLAMAELTVAFAGPGSLSIDALVRLSLSGTLWNIGALLAGFMSGGTALCPNGARHQHNKPLERVNISTGVKTDCLQIASLAR